MIHNPIQQIYKFFDNGALFSADFFNVSKSGMSLEHDCLDEYFEKIIEIKKLKPRIQNSNVLNSYLSSNIIGPVKSNDFITSKFFTGSGIKDNYSFLSFNHTIKNEHYKHGLQIQPSLPLTGRTLGGIQLSCYDLLGFYKKNFIKFFKIFILAIATFRLLTGLGIAFFVYLRFFSVEKYLKINFKIFQNSNCTSPINGQVDLESSILIWLYILKKIDFLTYKTIFYFAMPVKILGLLVMKPINLICQNLKITDPILTFLALNQNFYFSEKNFIKSFKYHQHTYFSIYHNLLPNKPKNIKKHQIKNIKTDTKKSNNYYFKHAHFLILEICELCEKKTGLKLKKYIKILDLLLNYALQSKNKKLKYLNFLLPKFLFIAHFSAPKSIFNGIFDIENSLKNPLLMTELSLTINFFLSTFIDKIIDLKLRPPKFAAQNYGVIAFHPKPTTNLQILIYNSLKNWGHLNYKIMYSYFLSVNAMYIVFGLILDPEKIKKLYISKINSQIYLNFIDWLLKSFLAFEGILTKKTGPDPTTQVYLKIPYTSYRISGLVQENHAIMTNLQKKYLKISQKIFLGVIFIGYIKILREFKNFLNIGKFPQDSVYEIINILHNHANTVNYARDKNKKNINLFKKFKVCIENLKNPDLKFKTIVNKFIDPLPRYIAISLKKSKNLEKKYNLIVDFKYFKILAPDISKIKKKLKKNIFDTSKLLNCMFFPIVIYFEIAKYVFKNHGLGRHAVRYMATPALKLEHNFMSGISKNISILNDKHLFDKLKNRILPYFLNSGGLSILGLTSEPIINFILKNYLGLKKIKTEYIMMKIFKKIKILCFDFTKLKKFKYFIETAILYFAESLQITNNMLFYSDPSISQLEKLIDCGCNSGEVVFYNILPTWYKISKIKKPFIFFLCTYHLKYFIKLPLEIFYGQTIKFIKSLKLASSKTCKSEKPLDGLTLSFTSRGKVLLSKIKKVGLKSAFEKVLKSKNLKDNPKISSEDTNNFFKYFCLSNLFGIHNDAIKIPENKLIILTSKEKIRYCLYQQVLNMPIDPEINKLASRLKIQKYEGGKKLKRVYFGTYEKSTKKLKFIDIILAEQKINLKMPTQIKNLKI